MEKLSKKSVISYSLGDLASQLVWTFVGMYLTVYYLDVVGLTPAIASTIMLVAKIWDAVNDPMMGAICERTKSKHGRFRPYILYGAPLLAIFSVLTFTAPFGNGAAGAVWATVTYIGSGMLYTLTNIPYGALAGVMTPHAEERVKLNSARGVGMQIGIIFVSFAGALMLAAISGNPEHITGRSYTIVAIIFALVSTPMFFLVFKNTKEVISPKVSDKKVSLKDSLRVMVTNKYLMIIVAITIFQMVPYMARISTMAFYVGHCLGDFRWMSILMTIPSIGALIGNIITPVIVKHLGEYGNRNALILSMFLKGITFMWMFIIPYDNIKLLIFVTCINAIVGFGFAPKLSMLSDAIDYQEEKTGVRSDGIAFAIHGLATKLGGAIGSAMGIMLISAFGYVSGEAVTARALTGINFTTNLFCGLLHLVAAIIPLVFWKMSDSDADSIRTKIEARNEMEKSNVA